MYKLIISLVVVIFCTQIAWAGESEDIAKITERLEKLAPQDKPESIRPTTRTDIRKGLMSKLNSSEMIVFSPKGKPRHILTVFTDIDCGYCRKLHAEMDELNNYGIEVRYMMFPRTGLNTLSYQKAVNVWCAKDQQASMTKAKAGESIPQANCDNPIASQFNLGQQLGVTGTPALLLSDGSLIPGYRPAKDLAAMLDEEAEKANY